MSSIAVFGGANMDILGMPRDGLRLRDSNIGRVILRPGGVGRNVAEQIAARGEACALFTVFGNDPMAETLKRDCGKKKIDISHALTAEGSTCVYLGLHDETGDMLAAINDMALTEKLTPAYAEGVMDEINRAGLCVLDANPPVETVRYVAEHAKIPLLMDAVSCAKLDRVRAVLPLLTAIKPNLMEARMLTGQDDPQDCAKALLSQGVRRAFISLGAEGICCADRDMCCILPVKQLNDAPKTGAGDALCAGLAIGIAKGKSTIQCAEYGMRCAADYLQYREDN